MKRGSKAGIIIASILSGLVLIAGLGIFIYMKDFQKKYTPVPRGELGIDWYNENTEEYIITTKEQLMDMSKLSMYYDFYGQTFKLGNDIVFNEGNAADWQYETPEIEWDSIYGFAGTFDGQGHTISGIYSFGQKYFANVERVEGYGYVSAALFRDTDPDCVIKNLRIVNSYFESDLDHGCASVSSNGAGTFENIYSNAIIRSQKCYVGGIVGQITGKTKISNCWFDGSIEMFMNNGRYVGGIAARTQNRADVVIEHCLCTADITSDLMNRGNQLGGILGQPYQSNVKITDCLYAGVITATNITGSVIGNAAPESLTTLTNVYTLTESHRTTIGAFEAGEIAGKAFVFDRAQLLGVGGYQWTNLDFENYWVCVEGKTPELKMFSENPLSLADVEKKVDVSWYDASKNEFVIHNEAELYGLALLSSEQSFEGKTFTLERDLVLNEGDASDWGENPPADTWQCIGSRDLPFAGTFDGQMHSISGIYMKTSDAYSGFFGSTGNSAVVKNLLILNSRFENGAAGVGSLVGQGVGTFDTIYSDADVVGANGNIGGFIGRATDKAEDVMTMTNCWFNGTITNTGNDSASRNTGGLIGASATKAEFYNCLNSAPIDITPFDTITDTNGNHVQPFAGGLAGYIHPNYSVSFSDCVNVGRILMSDAVTSAAGSIIGYSSGTTNISTTYTTKESSPFVTRGNVKGTPTILSEAELTGSEAYRRTILDFDEYWAVIPDSTPGLLSFVDHPESVAGVERIVDISWYDESASVYDLYDAADLRGFAMLSQKTDFAGKTVRLMNNITVNTGSAGSWASNPPESVWTPIGSRSLPFAGTFDGQMHAISGLYLKTEEQWTGLFSTTSPTSVVKRLSLTNSYFENSSAGGIGSIAGQAVGVFDTVFSNAIVIGKGAATGGLVGRATDKPEDTFTMRNCWFAGRVTNLTTSKDSRGTGGLIGTVITKASLTNCLNSGTVDVSVFTTVTDTNGNHVQPLAGGFIGYVNPGYSAALKDCLNSGEILMSAAVTSAAGSVLGYTSGNSTIANTYATEESSKFVIRGNYSGSPIVYPKEKLTGLSGYQWTTLDFDRYWAAAENSTPVLKSFAAGMNLSGVERAIDTTWYDEAKSEYVLTDAADLNGFAWLSQENTFAGKTVKLGADIDLNPGWDASSGETPDLQWTTPIGTVNKRFAGTFDGQGHTISGLYLNGQGDYQGLFSGTDNDSVIKDLYLRNSYLTTAGNGLGSVVGNARGTMERVYSSAIVYGQKSYVGGLAGMTSDKGTFTMRECCFGGSATINGAGSFLGGLVGLVQNETTTIENSLNLGEIYHKYSVSTAGAAGFVGGVQSKSIVNISDSVNHTNPAYTAGTGNGFFAGYLYTGAQVNLTNCHAVNWYSKALVGGVDNEQYPDSTRQNLADVAGTKSLSRDKVRNLFESESAAGHWVCSVDSLPILVIFEAEYAAGAVPDNMTWYDESKDEYILMTAEELIAFAALSQSTDFAGKTVKLGADIVLNEGSAEGFASAAPENVWTPISPSTGCKFAGTFDGQMHSISGLYLKSAAPYAGLFGYVGQTAVVKNLKLTNSYLETSTVGIGSIAGQAVGTLDTIYSDATVVGPDSNVGGLIGRATDGPDDTMTMTNCWFDGTVINTGNDSASRNTGGLIGSVITKAEISNSLNSGTVDITAFDVITDTNGNHVQPFAGGFVGYVNLGYSAALTDCVNTGLIHMSEAVTSAAGSVLGYAAGTAAVSNVYATEESSPFIVRGNVTGTPTVYPEAKLLGTGGYRYTALDFETYWAAVENGTPVLLSFTDGALDLTGVERELDLSWYDESKDEFIIMNGGELRGFAKLAETTDFTGKTVKLGADIDLNPEWTAGEEAPENVWTPIASINQRFNGTFDGQMHSISGVYVNTAAQYQGFFSATGTEAVVKDLYLKNSFFTSTSSQLGSLVGNAQGTFEGIYSDAVVKGNGNQIGGLIGATSSAGSVSLKDCWFAGSATINAKASYLGGLIGMVQASGGTTISNCLNTGEVYHKVSVGTAGTGGLVGYAAAKVTITDSVNHANPAYTAGSGVGVMVGRGTASTVSLTNCHSVHFNKNLVGDVSDNSTYPTCTRQNKADVAGLKSLTVAKVRNLFESETAAGHWMCSTDSLPVLTVFAEEYEAGTIEPDADADTGDGL